MSESSGSVFTSRVRSFGHWSPGPVEVFDTVTGSLKRMCYFKDAFRCKVESKGNPLCSFAYLNTTMGPMVKCNQCGDGIVDKNKVPPNEKPTETEQKRYPGLLVGDSQSAAGRLRGFKQFMESMQHRETRLVHYTTSTDKPNLSLAMKKGQYAYTAALCSPLRRPTYPTKEGSRILEPRSPELSSCGAYLCWRCAFMCGQANDRGHFSRDPALAITGALGIISDSDVADSEPARLQKYENLVGPDSKVFECGGKLRTLANLSGEDGAKEMMLRRYAWQAPCSAPTCNRSIYESSKRFICGKSEATPAQKAELEKYMKQIVGCAEPGCGALFCKPCSIWLCFGGDDGLAPTHYSTAMAIEMKRIDNDLDDPDNAD